MTKPIGLSVILLLSAWLSEAWAQETPPATSTSALDGEKVQADAQGEDGETADATPRADESSATPPPLPPTPPSSPREHQLPGVTVSERGTWRSSQSAFEVPRAVTVIGPEKMARGLDGVAIDHLRFEPGIWLDHRTTTTADPIIRGLAGGNLLYSQDGHTVSTLWGEGGFGSDDMYGKIDPFTVERIEVLRGPGSVPYGSNALGGVINVITRSAPHEFTDGGLVFGGKSHAAYGSAADGYTGRQEFWAAGGFFRVLVGATVMEVNDVEGGRGMGTFNNTSAEDYNYDLAADFHFAERFDLRVSWYDVDRNHSHRFYRPKQDNFNDREAFLTRLTVTEPTDWWDSVELAWYYQNKIDRRRWNYDNVKMANGVVLTNPRGEAITRTWQPRVEFVSSVSDHVLTYGVMSELSDGESPDDEEFTYHSQGQHWKASPDALWRYLAGYVQHEWAVTEWLTTLSTLRYDKFRFSTRPDGSVSVSQGFPATLLSMHERQKAVTGGLGATFHVAEGYNVYGNLSRGFRQYSPVLSISQVGAGVRVPSGLLDPVYSYTWEVGTKIEQEKWRAEAAFYRTRFDGFSTDDVPGTFQGSDWFDFNGNGTRDLAESVLKFQTKGWAYVYGADLGGEMDLHELFDLEDQWVLGGSFSWNIGRQSDRQAGGLRTPVRFVQPARGIARIRWEEPGETGAWVEVLGEAVGAFNRVPDGRKNDAAYRRFPDLADSDPKSPRIRANGTLPGFTVAHLRGGYRLGEGWRLNFAIDNLTDRNVRRAHSRMSDPGINFAFGVTAEY